MTNTITFQQGKKQRNELQLPILHFVAADDWIDKLGNDAFCAWLKFYSWCDRSDNRIDTENDVVPTSITKIIKRLGISREKFYKKILPALWDYGLIDLKEYEQSTTDGQKPMNIVVYDSPQNQSDRKFKTLEKVRDYATEYISKARSFAKRRGHNKQSVQSSKEQKSTSMPPRSKIEQGGVRKSNGARSEIEHNNVSKVFNVSNLINNDSNQSTDKSESINNSNLPILVQKVVNKHQKRLIDDRISLEDIESNYAAHKEHLTVGEYQSALDFVLSKYEGPIVSFNACMKKASDDQLNFREKANQSHQPQQDTMPKWFKDEEDTAAINTDELTPVEDQDDSNLEDEKANFQRMLEQRRKQRSDNPAI